MYTHGSRPLLDNTPQNQHMNATSWVRFTLSRIGGCGNHGPSLKVEFFVWIATFNRCWTADRLIRRGLPHPKRCPFCDQAEENINHILVSCVFAREAWFHALQMIGLEMVAPTPQAESFQAWWRRTGRRVSVDKRKGFNSMVMLII